MMYDICVVGLGGMGSAILAECARRGVRAIGLEQWARGHDLGSSSGRTRMIRKAYFEDAAYVPLARRAYELWRSLENEVDEKLLQVTGVLAVGTEKSEIIAGTARSAREHNLPIESFSNGEIRKRFPTVRFQDDEIAILESDGGVLNPERAVAAHLSVAEKHGATARFNVAMKSWNSRDDGSFNILLNDGSSVSARGLILALGPWFQRALGDLGVPVRVQRNVQAWFAPANGDYALGSFPAFLLDRKGLPAPLYGFPDFGDGVKAAFHGVGDFTEAGHVEREIDQARDINPLARALNAWMPGLGANMLSAKVCMYSLTPDEHFVVDRHREHERLILCGGFSGHGFKFAPVIAEIAADLALNGGTTHPIDFLSLGRFSGNGR